MGTKGGPEQFLAVWGYSLATRPHLFQSAKPRMDSRKVGMIPGVITDSMAGFCRFSHDLRIFSGGLTNHKEGSLRLIFFQNMQDTGSMLRVRTIIECQRYDRFLSFNVGNESRIGWHLQVLPTDLNNECST